MPASLMNDERYQLTAWVEKHYRDRLHARDLADQLLREGLSGAG